MRGNGMAATVGRLRPCNLFDWKFVVLSHNVIRGAAGAAGLLIEVHPDPDRALSDGAQSLRPEQFEELMSQLRIIAPAVGRTI